MRLKQYTRYLFGTVFFVFALNKLFPRDWVLENELPLFFAIMVYFLPDLAEAIMGTIVVTAVTLQLRDSFRSRTGDITV